MKILTIRGCNLASLEGKFEIDFTAEPLLSAGIFAISGPTGAGKSTLLDAMCLALFSRTPRMEQAQENGVQIEDVGNSTISQNDPRSILRRGATSGYAEADFLAIDGHRYRSRWDVRRSRDKADGNLQKSNFTLRNLDTGMEEQGTKTELQARVVKLIGLTFDQFTRSVLLAQNDFSTFLKADQGEKAALLEKLTGTEQYSSISRLIYKKNAVAREDYEKVQECIRGIVLLTDGEEKELQDGLCKSEKLVAELEKAGAEEQTLREALRSAEQNAADREAQQKASADRLRQATERLEAARKEYDRGKEEEQKSEATFKTLQKELQEARKKDIELTEAARKSVETEERLKSALRKKQTHEDRMQTAKTSLQKITEELTSLEAWRERHAGKANIAEQHSALLLHLNEAAKARQSLERSKKAIATARREMESLAGQLEKVQRILETKALTIRETEESVHSLEEELKAEDREALEKHLNAVRTEREGLLLEQARQAVSGDIKELREKLQDGSPCPVCGSLHHPALTHTAGTALTEQIAALTLKMEQLSARRQTVADKEKSLSALRQKLVTLHQELSEHERLRADNQSRQTLLKVQIERDAKSAGECKESFEGALSSADALFGNKEWQKGWLSNQSGFLASLATFAERWNTSLEQLQQLRQQQSAARAEYDSLESLLVPLKSEAEEAAQIREQSRAVLTRLKTERAQLLDGRPADAVEREYNEYRDALRARLQSLQASETEQSGIAEREKGISEQIVRDMEKAAAALLQCRKALSEWSEAWSRNHGEETLSVLLSRSRDKKNELSYRLRSNEENRQKVASRQKELEECRLRSERWAKLNDLAGSADGSKFRRIAQCYTLDILLRDANAQLRNLSRRYLLKRIPDTLALQVVDLFMGGEVRSVHSLSGGETFLVSLALALGLSSLSSGRMSVESLFIDEGFGSLDADTLRVAMDALENLRTQGRKIGVISHVQEMTERIPVQIHVNRVGNGRSNLKIESI